MIRGLYSAASGIATQTAKNDVYAANLANVSTAGYRRSRVTQTGFPRDLAIANLLSDASASSGATSGLRGGVTVSAAGIDLSPGPISQTNNDFDLAISGAGFFCLNSPQGVIFTRSGQFQLDASNTLVSRSGYPVLGRGGPIRVTSGSLRVDESGQVWDGGQPVDTLRIVTFADSAALTKTQGGLLAAGGWQPATGYKIIQGAVEGSNVEAMAEMQKMMNGLRLYEANVRALQAQDDSIATLLREAVG
jgi:flagellar basal-body rod protein FlgF